MTRWLSTLVLAIAAAAGVLWLGFGDWTRQKLGVVPATPDSTSAAAIALKKHLQPEAIRRIERSLPGGDTDVLIRGEDGEWTQPGNWPVRQADARELAKSLCDLTTRFQPIPLPEKADLAAYGLDASRRPIVARVDTATKTLTLKFGQAPLAPGESPFGRTTYLQVDDQPELLRLGPDTWAAISKPPETYRRRQLFPDLERVKLTGGEPPFNPLNPQPPAAGRTAIPTDKLASIRADGPAGGFEIRRVAATPRPLPDPDNPSADPMLNANAIAAVWEIAEAAEPGTAFKPVRDRVEPAKLRAILSAIPDLWAEQFVSGRTDAETGLDKPQRSLQLGFANGTSATLRIGRLSRVARRDTAPPPPSPFGEPPPPQNVVEEFYFARLDNNPLVFELNGAKLNDLFAAADGLRDPAVARFESDDVVELTITTRGQPPIQLVKKKGDKDAEKDDERQDRWYLGERLAEAPRVTELLDAISRLEARESADRIDEGDPDKLTELGFTPESSTVTIVTEKSGTRSTATLTLGKHDAEGNKLNVMAAGWPRVNRVADDVLKLIERPALAYRGRRLFDTAQARLTGITATPAAGAAFALQQDAGKSWQITQPITAKADADKADSLAADLSRLEVIDYVDETPKPEDLEQKYGLTKPAGTLRLTFEGGREQALEFGKDVEFKPEVYARLAGAESVFTLPKATVERATAGAAGLMPLQLWSTASDKVQSIEIARAGGDTYKLAMDAGNWKLTGPFEAPIPYLAAQPLLAAAGAVAAERYEALAPADLAKYGLDAPPLKVTIVVMEKKGEAEEPVARTLLLGTAAADTASQRYAMLDGTQAVFVMPDSLFKEADKPALDRLDRTLRNLDQNAITKVVIAGPRPESNATLIRENDAWKAEGQAFVVDMMAVQGLLNAVARPVANSIAAYGSAVNLAEFGLDKPEHTITATLADMKTHTLAIGKAAPGGGRYARVDDGPAVAILPEPVVKSLARGTLEFVDRGLLNFDAAQFSGLKRVMGDAVLEIVPGATTGWDMTAPAKHKADQPLLDELADRLSRLRAESVAAYAPEDLAPFGLAEPAAAITLKVGLEEPKELILKLGRATDDGGGRFATVDGRTVAVLPNALVEKLTADPLKFRDRALARFVDADRATLTRGDRTVTFAKISGTWKLVKPLEAAAEQADLDELIDAAARLRADEIVAEKPESLEPFGLDAPDAVWTFAAGDKDMLKLSLGKRDGSGDRVHAKVEGSDLVVLLDSRLTSRLFTEYRRRSVWSGVDAAQVEAFAVSGAAGGFSLRKAGPAWEDPARPGEAVNAQAVSEFLDKLAGLQAERYAADEGADWKLFGLDPPQRVIVLTLRGGGTRTLHLGREEGGEGGRLYARVMDKDRSDALVLSAADSRVLSRDRAAFAAVKSP